MDEMTISRYWRTINASYSREIKYVGGRTGFWENFENIKGLSLKMPSVRSAPFKDRHGEFLGISGVVGIFEWFVGPNDEEWYWEIPCHFARRKNVISQSYGFSATKEQGMEKCDKYIASLDYIVLHEKHRYML